MQTFDSTTTCHLGATSFDIFFLANARILLADDKGTSIKQSLVLRPYELFPREKH